MFKKTLVSATVNGEQVTFLCAPHQSLLECLRNILGLTGAKEGCNDGNCGACRWATQRWRRTFRTVSFRAMIGTCRTLWLCPVIQALPLQSSLCLRHTCDTRSPRSWHNIQPRSM